MTRVDVVFNNGANAGSTKQDYTMESAPRKCVMQGVLTTSRGDDYHLEVFGYRCCTIRTSISWVFVVATLGILRLVFHWRPDWRLKATHTRCTLNVASAILILETYQRHHKSFYVEQMKTLTANNEDGSASTGRTSERDVVEHHRELLPVFLRDGTFKEMDSLRLLDFKKEKYVWDEDEQCFGALAGLDDSSELQRILENPQGLSNEQQRLRKILYGRNEIEVPVQSVATLVLLEVLNPFYMFQVFSLTVWFAEHYYYYTIAIIVLSLYGIAFNVLQTYRNQRNLHSRVHSVDRAEILHAGSASEHVNTSELVPGDVIVIPQHGCIMQCDAVLIRGTCIVNESMLTGESVPVTKTSVLTKYSSLGKKDRSHHTLFCGTRVIQTRYYGNEQVLAVVTNTNFMTAKGNLVRSILYPPPVDFKFDKDSYKFIGFLAVIAAFGLVYTVIIKVLRQISAVDIIIKSLDIITIAIPPVLPAAMTVGRLYAQTRLKNNKIFCINSHVINVAGSINCVCFDKTGTLTEDGLDLWGVLPVENGVFQEPHHNALELPSGSLLPVAMASCHTLTKIDGELLGDPHDVKIFEFTGWELEEPEIADCSKYDSLVPTVVKSPPSSEFQHEFGLIQQFQFSSGLQRMSVISRQLGHKEFLVVCKGSPEMISSLSLPETVPSDFDTRLREYTEQGYRIISIGWRVLNDISYTAVQRLQREDVEKDLIFGGIIVMENRLKPQTTGIISVLRKADMKVVMVTGDNILTAVSVARECGLIAPEERVIDVLGLPSNGDSPPQLYFTSPESQQKTILASSKDTWHSEQPYTFAMTGSTWSVLRDFFPGLLPRVLVRGVVFARMSPEQKQQLVGHLQELGYFVAMCGDGANDCGALKAAHVGISLSEAESSVASPFTYTEANVSCVPLVVKEGRAALVTSFGVFKFIAGYSLTQFVSVMILYYTEGNLTDFEFLFIDLVLSLSFAFFFGRTRAFSGPLVSEPPISSLLTPVPIVSLMLQVLLNICMQSVIFFLVQMQPWYVSTEHGNYSSFENYAVFTLSLYQYITMAVVFSKGPPYREKIWTNFGLSTAVIVLTVICCYITLWPAEWVTSFFDILLPPVVKFRVFVIILAVVGFLISMFVEDVLVDLFFMKKLKAQKMCAKQPRFVITTTDLEQDYKWPPIGPPDDCSAQTMTSSPRLSRPSITITVLTETNNGKLNLQSS